MNCNKVHEGQRGFPIAGPYCHPILIPPTQANCRSHALITDCLSELHPPMLMPLQGRNELKNNQEYGANLPSHVVIEIDPKNLFSSSSSPLVHEHTAKFSSPKRKFKRSRSKAVVACCFAIFLVFLLVCRSWKLSMTSSSSSRSLQPEIPIYGFDNGQDDGPGRIPKDMSGSKPREAEVACVKNAPDQLDACRVPYKCNTQCSSDEFSGQYCSHDTRPEDLSKAKHVCGDTKYVEDVWNSRAEGRTSGSAIVRGSIEEPAENSCMVESRSCSAKDLQS